MTKDNDTCLASVSSLRLTQLYLSEGKLDAVKGWFHADLHNFQPVSVHDFLKDGNLYITDGHTRAFAAWQAGIKDIPIKYDYDDLVTNTLGQAFYREDIAWCERFGLRQIGDLANRILSETAFDELWRGRCAKKHNLILAINNGLRRLEQLEDQRRILEQSGLFVYGISSDHKTLYCEDARGRLSDIPYR